MKNKILKRGERRIASFLFLGIAIFLSACTPENNGQGVPHVLVNESINLRSPIYANLDIQGWAYVPNVGVRGIILLKDNAFTYRAYERFCPYRPEDSNCG